ncbi:Hypothetical protein SRAE_X000227200 [Strongyloides ratti]|uniref:Uncharacterized protein n=1 Tax=Strongyloides ratti TaxID=34506 RepID=A0A090KSQ5_STRRB|nr:Hypothetical protein SRAE_X000227200 [Strongyloides ratti]CEF60535.1 Hypothetical protein SRAE_X000227200 [Strongyloides ratti]
MHCIKYLAIFAIFAIQFSLQDVSSEESSSQVAVTSHEGNNLPEEQEVVQTKKSLLGNFKNKLSEKTKGLKSRLNQAKDKVKSGLEKVKNEVNEKFKSNSKFQKGIELKDKVKNKVSDLRNNFKKKLPKIF